MYASNKLSEMEKMIFLSDVNNRLSNIPKYNLQIPKESMLSGEMYKNSDGYYFRNILEHNEYCDTFLGKDRDTAIVTLAMQWVWFWGFQIDVYEGGLYPNSNMQTVDAINKFQEYCKPYLASELKENEGAS